MSNVRFREEWSISRGKYGRVDLLLKAEGIHEAMDPILPAIRGSLNSVLSECHYEMPRTESGEPKGDREPPSMPKEVVFVEADVWRSILRRLRSRTVGTRADIGDGDHVVAANLLRETFGDMCPCPYCNNVDDGVQST